MLSNRFIFDFLGINRFSKLYRVKNLKLDSNTCSGRYVTDDYCYVLTHFIDDCNPNGSWCFIVTDESGYDEYDNSKTIRFGKIDKKTKTFQIPEHSHRVMIWSETSEETVFESLSKCLIENDIIPESSISTLDANNESDWKKVYLNL